MLRCSLSGDRGSATPVLVAVVAMLAVLALAAAQVGVLVAARAQAANAADAAALAAAVATYPSAAPGLSPWVSADGVVRLNGARLDRCSCEVNPSLNPRSVTVVAAVPVDVPLFGVLTVRAASSAEFDPGSWLGR